MYYNIEENKKINNSLEFRELFPNTIFPKILTDEIMREHGYKKVVVNQSTPTKFSKIKDGEIEVVNGIPTINQTLEYLSLYQCKETALSDIKANREQSASEPIDNIQVATLQDRENIQGSIEYFDMLSQGKGTITWTMSNNIEQELSLEDLKGALDTYIVRKAQAFAEYQTKKQLIENAVTEAEFIALLPTVLEL